MDTFNEKYYTLYKYDQECIFKVKIVKNETEAKEWSSYPRCFYSETQEDKKFLCC